MSYCIQGKLKKRLDALAVYIEGKSLRLNVEITELMIFKKTNDAMVCPDF
jgi:hypothetical protein